MESLYWIGHQALTDRMTSLKWVKTNAIIFDQVSHGSQILLPLHNQVPLLLIIAAVHVYNLDMQYLTILQYSWYSIIIPYKKHSFHIGTVHSIMCHNKQIFSSSIQLYGT